MRAGRHQWFKPDSKARLQYIWDEAIEKRGIRLEARVGVDLNEPGFEIPIKHKVEAEELKVRRFPFIIDGTITGKQDIINN